VPSRLPIPLAFAALAALAAAPVAAATVHTELAMATPTGPGASIGMATIADGPKGATVTVDLHGLPPGQHGLHVHMNGTCQPNTGADGKVVPAGAAGAHYDPGQTGHHMGPMGEGHLGDLPRVEVAADGTAKATMLAPRIKDVAALKNRTLMLHVGGDTYSEPPPLGGGGARLACGMLQ
jgi:superoxide dismutase, Cu-Zn family